MKIDTNELNKLSQEAYSIAVEHGWHEKKVSAEHCLMLAITELSEAIETDRHNKTVDTCAYESAGKDSDAYKNYIKGSIEEEFADICIRLFDLAGYIGCDFSKYELVDDKFAPGKNFTERAYVLSSILCTWVLDTRSKIAKAVEYTFEWANTLGIDIMYHIREKMRYNANRSYKHGGKKY